MFSMKNERRERGAAYGPAIFFFLRQSLREFHSPMSFQPGSAIVLMT